MHSITPNGNHLCKVNLVHVSCEGGSPQILDGGGGGMLVGKLPVYKYWPHTLQLLHNILILKTNRMVKKRSKQLMCS